MASWVYLYEKQGEGGGGRKGVKRGQWTERGGYMKGDPGEQGILREE